MRRIALLLVITIVVLSPVSAYPRYGNWPELVGPYLGQEPPGMTAEVFAPGVVSTDGSEINSVFSPDGSEFYFTTWEPETGTRILVSRRVDGFWKMPQPASFSTDPSDVDPAMSQDGQRLFFSTRRPRPGEVLRRESGFDMWYVRRERSGWGEAQFLGSVVNSGRSQVYATSTRNGGLYFQAIREGGYGKADIYRSRWLGGAFQEPENLGPAINSDQYEGDVFVAPDESYLVVSAYGRDDGFGEGDLYIGFRSTDGGWSTLKNMGAAVNSEEREFCPMVSPDGRFLFFTSKRNGEGDIFWVDSRIIEALRAVQVK